jgi:hypothetical protein
VPIDVGSDLAMHMQQIGVIRRATGLPYTQYWLAKELTEICLADPSLLHLDPKEEEAVILELEQWHKKGEHSGVFHQLKGPGRNSWMAT